MDVSVVHNWVKITVFVQLKISLEINLEVFENELDVAVVWQEPEVDILLGINFPVFDSWEFNTKESFVE
jgi:hypothetical protein